MPYIRDVERKEIEQGKPPATAGELNYCFTLLINEYLNTLGERYQTYNDIVGALEGCKLELYRRKICTYEDRKRDENGEVYEMPQKGTEL